MDPVLGGEVVERQEHVEVVGDLGDRLGPLGAVVGLERLGGLDGVVAVRGVVDLRECLLRCWVRGLGQRGQDVADLVKP
jgi:hypothetical protein